MKEMQIFFNLLALITLGIFISWLVAKADGCSVFNPDVACTRSMYNE